mgnify:CR=1 FL=1|jgi:hypothetical protein
MSDLSVSDADGIVLIHELERRFGFKPIISTNPDGTQEIKAIIPMHTATIDINEEE